MKMYILVDKIPVETSDIEEWGNNLEKTRKILFNEINDCSVSTVFLGIDHGFGNLSVPVLFETMIFGGIHDQYQTRYTTYDDAVNGHREACILAGIIQIERDNKLNDILKIE